MKTLEIGTKVVAHNGTSSIGGMFITETFLNGEIVKVNKKSIKVNLTNTVVTENGKEKETVVNIEGLHTFKFWKTVDEDTFKNKIEPKDLYVSTIGLKKFVITL